KASAPGSLRISIGSEKVQRHVRLRPDHPAVVRFGPDVEERAGRQLDDDTVLERDGGPSRQDQPEMLDRAAPGADGGPHIGGPLPPGLVGRSADREVPETDDLEPAVPHLADIVRFLEPLEQDAIDHRWSPDVHFNSTINTYVSLDPTFSPMCD